MVQKARKALLRVLLRCFSYPVQSARHWFRPRRAGRGRLGRVSLGNGAFLHGIMLSRLTLTPSKAGKEKAAYILKFVPDVGGASEK